MVVVHWTIDQEDDFKRNVTHYINAHAPVINLGFLYDIATPIPAFKRTMFLASLVKAAEIMEISLHGTGSPKSIYLPKDCWVEIDGRNTSYRNSLDFHRIGHGNKRQ